jgi:ligand-binding sensor domain-containing protein
MAGSAGFIRSKRHGRPILRKRGSETEIKSLVKIGERMWAGGIGGSLFEYDQAGDRWKKIEAADPLKNGEIQALIATRDRVFVCRDNGVSLYDLSTGQWESFSAADGLLSNSVFYAAEDRNSIWFGTDKGAQGSLNPIIYFGVLSAEWGLRKKKPSN